MNYPQRLRISIFIDLSNMTSLLNLLADYVRYLSRKGFDKVCGCERASGKSG
jgi:hypothetical protein